MLSEWCEGGGAYTCIVDHCFLFLLYTLNLGFIRNSHGKTDDYQTVLATSMHIGMDVYTQNQTATNTRTHLPMNLGVGREYVGYLI